MLQNVTFAFRALRRRPLFALSAILVLAFGIGANTAIFTLLRGIVLQPLAYPEPDQLVTVWEDHSRRDGPEQEWTSRSTLWDWRQQNQVFEGLAGYRGWQPILAGGVPEQLAGRQVTADFFSVLGVETALGRSFEGAEGEVGAAPVVVLSQSLFERRFGGDGGWLGKSVELDGTPHTVIGVLPAGFRSPVGPSEIWRPMPLGPAIEDRGAYYVRTIARLEHGVSLQLATADMQRVAASVAERAPESYQGVTASLVPLHDQLTDPVRPALLALMAAVALLLLVTCANVANLLLVRGASRQQELAVRASLGADRRRLVSQLLIESQVLALAGGGLGVALGALGSRLLMRLAPPGTPRLEEVGLDGVTAAFVVALTLLTGLVFGVLPALLGTRPELVESLRAGTRQPGGAHGRTRHVLVVAEMALALVLLVCAGLLTRSLWHLVNVDVGFEAEGVMTTGLRLSGEAYKERQQRIDFYHGLLEGLAARSEIETVAAVSILPMSGDGSDISYYVEGSPPVAAGHEPAVWIRQVSDAYFDTLRIPLRLGRAFDARDHGQAPKAVAISERFAKRWFGGANPLGHRIKLGPAESEAPWATVVGVVADVHDRSPMMPLRDDIYLALSQWGGANVSLVARGAGGRRISLAALRSELDRHDASLPLSAPTMLGDLVSRTLWLPRLTAQLLMAFSAASLLLAALGVYSVLAFAVIQRRREVGLRMALGARPREILVLMLRLGLLPAMLGLGLGLLVSLAAMRALGGLLHCLTSITFLRERQLELCMGESSDHSG